MLCLRDGCFRCYVVFDSEFMGVRVTYDFDLSYVELISLFGLWGMGKQNVGYGDLS